nr:immunoglobulin light chain junction region [Macaca mulatta]
CLKYNISPYSF